MKTLSRIQDLKLLFPAKILSDNFFLHCHQVQIDKVQLMYCGGRLFNSSHLGKAKTENWGPYLIIIPYLITPCSSYIILPLKKLHQ